MAPFGWGAAWGQFPWGGEASVEARLIQKIISVLKTVGNVTKYVGTGDDARIYGGFPNTIQDVNYPVIAIEFIDSPGRMTNPSIMDSINLRISVLMKGVGKNAAVWDDMIECYEAILDALHHGTDTLFDTTIGIRVLNMRCYDDGGQSMDDDVMIYDSKWNAIAQIRGKA